MDPLSRRGQILTEVIWSMLLLISFAAFLLRLHRAATIEHAKPRWEIEQGRER
jgi:hypothetical protein